MNWIFIDKDGTEREYPVHPKRQDNAHEVKVEVLTLAETGEEVSLFATYQFNDKAWIDCSGRPLLNVIAWRYPTNKQSSSKD